MADKRIPAAAIRRAWLDLSVPVTRAAAALGLHPDHLRRRARRLGLPPRRGGRRLTLTDPDLALRLYREGVPLAEIGARCGGVRPQTVWHYVARIARLPRSRRRGQVGSPKVWDRDLARRMWLAGVSKPDIAATVGVATLTIGRWAAREGLPRRSQSWRPAMTLAGFHEAELARAMAEAARRDQAEWRLAEMVDPPSPGAAQKARQAAAQRAANTARRQGAPQQEAA